MNSDCSVWKFQASFALKGAVYASATAWKDMKGCYPMRNLNKTLAKCYVYEVTVKEEESEGCNIKVFLNILSVTYQSLFSPQATYEKIQRSD